jgi:endogenous inhibitor of DNA gyrase (YacG/DUF329 family)
VTRLGPCPLCDDEGPWENAAARAAHIRAHHTADCGLCGQPVNASGLDAHMRYVHGDTPEPEPAAPEPEPVPSAPAPEPAVAPVTAETIPAAKPAAPTRVDRGAEVECPDCGIAVRQRGLGQHRAGHRRRAAAKAAPRNTLTATLTHLIPGAAPDLVDRLVEFIDQAREKPEPGLWIVAPLNGTRPWLCRTAAIGVVVAREHTATLVVSVDDIYAELHRPQTLAS